MITRGMAAGGSSLSSRKAYACQMHNILVTQKTSKTPRLEDVPITFSEEDARGAFYSHDDALVISLKIFGYSTRHVLIDNGSSADIIYLSAFQQMKIGKDQLRPIETESSNRSHPYSKPIQFLASLMARRSVLLSFYRPAKVLQANPSYQQWISRDQGLLTLINSTLSPTALSLVVGQTTAHGVWSILEKRYTSASSTTIRTRNDATNFEDIHVLLITEEQSLKSSIDLSKDHPHMAMMANANRNNTMFASQGNRGRGRNNFNCGRGRNFNNNNSGRGGYNPSRGNSNHSGGFNGNFTPSPNQSYIQRPSCQICGKIGHAALDYYHCIDYAYQGKQPSSKLTAMAATSNAQHSDQSYWISNTDATDHFTPNLFTIPEHQEYTGSDQATVDYHLPRAICLLHGSNSSIIVPHMTSFVLLGVYVALFSIHTTPHKLQPRSVECVFLGYATSAKGYLCYDPLSHKYYTSRHVTITESIFPFQRSSQPPTPSNISPSWLHTNLYFHSCPFTSIFGTGPTTSILGFAPLPTPFFTQDSTESSPNPPIPNSPAPPITPIEQSPVPSPIASVPSVPLPTSCHPMQTHSNCMPNTLQWQDTMLSEFQALQRQETWTLVPSSPQQMAFIGMDFDETFSPVVKPATVCLVLSIAAQQNWSLRQLYVSNAFLHGCLKETIYMEQPPGNINPAFPHHICKLKNDLYGLKQAPRAWFERFTLHLLTIGFTPSLADPSLFLYRHGTTVMFLLLYIEYCSSGFFVHQWKYASNLLQKFNISTCKACSTPFVSLSRLRKDEGIPLSYPTPFRSMVGGLQYLTFTRHDLSFAGTLDHGLTFRPDPLSHTAFTDSSWAGDPMDRRNNPQCRDPQLKQEYHALANCTADLAWVRMVLKDLGIFLATPPIIWCDNLSALDLASNPVFHARTKHVEVDYHFIREKVVNKDIQFHHISIDDQLADILTKALPSPRFLYLRNKLMPPLRHSFAGG
uniref:Uncharacterized protein n=1 Tax=Fagus sylvatica TaxID=28930 RepID=A0A2N9HP43_FAGSY